MPTAVAATAFSTITDLSAGDTISLNNGVATFGTTKLSLVSTATFADYLAAAAAVATVTATTTENAAWFQFSGNTYLVVDGYGASSDAAGYTAGEDSVIEITGLVDLSKAVFSSTADTLTIV
jgi:S-layer protein